MHAAVIRPTHGVKQVAEVTEAIYPWREDAYSETDWKRSEDHADDDKIELEQPYSSRRLQALEEAELQPPGSKYVAARQHGLALGYNIFKAAPPPPLDPQPPQSAFLVDTETLQVVPTPYGASKDGDPEMRARRMAAERSILLHDPTEDLYIEHRALTQTGTKLGRLDMQLALARTGIVGARMALTNGEGSTSEARQQAENARALATEHAAIQDVNTELIEQYDKAWLMALAAGEAARKAALIRMVEQSDSLHVQMQDVQLRLTDHVLLGVEEEAERMAKAEGPDGDRLRELRRALQVLAEKQTLQKAVLVNIARKAVVAKEGHNVKMEKYVAEALVSSNSREQLIGEEDLLQHVLQESTGAVSPGRLHLKTRTPQVGLPVVVHSPGKHADADAIAAATSSAAAAAAADAAEAANAANVSGCDPDVEMISATTQPPGPQVAFASGVENEVAADADLTPYLVVRAPTSKLGAKAWHVLQQSLTASSSGLGLTLARDDTLPYLLLSSKAVKKLHTGEVAATKLTTGKKRLSKGTKRLPLCSSLIVTGVQAGSAVAGVIQESDVLVEMNNVPLGDGAALTRLTAGQKVTFLIARPTITAGSARASFRGSLREGVARRLSAPANLLQWIASRFSSKRLSASNE